MTTTISGSNGIVFPDATSMQTGQQAVKAWVNFNGQGVVAIRAGYNVSSISDNATGNYTVNFTTAMPDVNYSASGICFENPATSAGIVRLDTQTVSSCQVFTQQTNGPTYDSSVVCLQVFR
tara:strand:- start:36 stop:398 length:363 start_codon:yes stop_codon:yes gene_type:complete